MPIRRHSDPINVKRIWDAIRAANHSRQVCDLARITKYLQNVDDYTPSQVELYVKQTLKDKLILPTRKTAEGVHHSFKITQQELPELDGKDWYCFECHLAGDVFACSKCFRVYHSECITGAKKKFEAQKKSNNYPKEGRKQLEDSCKKSKTDDASNSESNDQSITILSDDSDDMLDSSSKSLNKSLTTDVDTQPKSVDSSTNENNQSEWVDKGALTYDETLCSVCNINRIDYDCGMDQDEINYMLKFVLNRIRAWLPNTITHTMAEEERPEWLTDSELTWRANQLFFEHRDMSVIEVKLNTMSYNTISEFLEDIFTVQHNVAIFHGIESQEYAASELMIRDTLHDITEMKNCIDCYKYSNEKLNPRWFCLPCRVPHQLVWAKQKGYPYWPAKVLKETSTHFDVRFFGGKYERALLIKSLVKPITVSKESLQIKNSTAFSKSLEELKYHQLLLNDPVELEKLKLTNKSRRRTLSKQKTTPTNTSRIENTVTRSRRKTNNSTRRSSEERLSEVNTRSAEKRRSNNCVEAEDKRRKTEETEQTSNESINGNVIDISDGEEEECTEYSFRENIQDSFNLDETYEQVSSSTENFGKQLSSRHESGMQRLDQPYSDSVEKMRRKLECLSNKKEIIKCSMDCMQMEIDKITNDHNDHLKRLFESHNQQISETKKKQWCYNCEQDAIYHCCWNTAYCSQTCQQQHWQAEHKKVCRRKR